jgi:hypothetical protein
MNVLTRDQAMFSLRSRTTTDSPSGTADLANARTGPRRDDIIIPQYLKHKTSYEPQHIPQNYNHAWTAH